MASAFKVRLGAQLGSTDLSSQLNAGKEHSNGIGFHVIVNLINPVGTAITFEDCGVDCSNTTSNYVIFHSPDVTTETDPDFALNAISLGLSGVSSTVHLYEIKYKSGHAHHHIRAIITPPGCSSSACEIIEESILCDLGTVPGNGQCDTCSTGHFQQGITCAACASGKTSAPKAISCDVFSNSAFDALSDTIQEQIQQSVRSMQTVNTLAEAEKALRDMIVIVKQQNTAQSRIFVMGNAMSSIFRNLPVGVRPNDIQMDVTRTDAQLPGAVDTFIQQDFPQYTSQNVRWVGAKTGDHDTCDLDIHQYMGVMEVLIDVDVNPYAVLCRGSTKIVKVHMTNYNAATGIETVETRCWNGASWGSAVTRQTGSIYYCNNEYLFVGSAGAINNQTNACPNTDASAPNTLVGCDCGSDQCFGNSAAGNGPYCDLAINDCKWTCIAEYQEMQTSEGHVAVNQLKVGDKIKLSNGKYTVVKQIMKEAAPRNILHEVECNGATAHLTENHAYRCNDRWYHPRNRGRRLAETGEMIDVYSIKTENHCKDRLLTSSGLEIEPWDGREADAVRPYFYDETGFRRNCMRFD